MRLFFVLCLVAGLTACSGLTKEKLGLGHRSPNETKVESRAPLSLPPEFDVRPRVVESVD